MPHTLRTVDLDDETLAELGVLCAFDDDLAGQITATSKRIRGLLTQIHPALERASRPHPYHSAVSEPLTRISDPAGVEGRRPLTFDSAIAETDALGRGNKKLKYALLLSAFAALHRPPSTAYYGRKRAEG